MRCAPHVLGISLNRQVTYDRDHMRFESMIFSAFAFDFAGTFKCGQRAIERLVRKAELGGKVLQCAAQFDVRPSAPAFEQRKVSNAFACRADVSLFDASAEVHHLMGKGCGERLSSLRVFLKGGQHFALRIYAHSRIGACYRITMILG